MAAQGRAGRLQFNTSVVVKLEDRTTGFCWSRSKYGKFQTLIAVIATGFDFHEKYILSKELLSPSVHIPSGLVVVVVVIVFHCHGFTGKS